MDTDNWLSLMVLVLAVDAIMVVWFRGGWYAGVWFWRPVAGVRAYMEAWQESLVWHKRWFARAVNFLAFPFGCSLCLPLHVALWLYLLSQVLPYSDKALFVLAAGGLASRLMNGIR